jgi:hypothetical protein
MATMDASALLLYVYCHAAGQKRENFIFVSINDNII